MSSSYVVKSLHDTGNSISFHSHSQSFVEDTLLWKEGEKMKIHQWQLRDCKRNSQYGVRCQMTIRHLPSAISSQKFPLDVSSMGNDGLNKSISNDELEHLNTVGQGIEDRREPNKLVGLGQEMEKGSVVVCLANEIGPTLVENNDRFYVVG
ncbi:hypothetical protein Ancab_029670 [Ancistrocladus abbreviatus]